MRYLTILLFLYLFSSTTLSQEKREVINGKVKLAGLPIHDVHITNLNTNIGTISNDLGIFNIPVKQGDSISISHLNLKNLTVIITKKNTDSLTLSITLAEEITTLNAFTLERPRGIFEQDKDILLYDGPTVNAQTLKLPYANTKISTDDAVFKIQSGAVVSLSNLVSVLDGSKKRAKALEKLSFEDAQLKKIRNFFTDDFFMTDLQIQEEYINSFLNFCVKKNIIRFFNKKNNLRLTKILLRESNLFPQKDSSLIKVAFKKN
jgi:hypothetical protein